MATKSVAATVSKDQFTHWGRAVDDGTLDLWIQRGDKIVESISLNVTELPQRPDLFERLGPKIRARMLWEAREVAKGNMALDPCFPGYEGLVVDQARHSEARP